MAQKSPTSSAILQQLRLYRMPLRMKIILLFVTAAIVGSGFVMLYWMPRAQQESIKQLTALAHSELGTIAVTLAAPMARNEYGQIQETLSAALATHPDWETLELSDKDDTLLFPLATKNKPATAPHRILEHQILERGRIIGKLRLVRDFANEFDRLHAEHIRLVITLLIATALVLISTLAMIDRLVRRPIRELSEAAKRLADGAFDSPLPLAASDEIGDLVQNFDTMRNNVRLVQEHLTAARAELAHSETRFRDFSAAASDYCWEMDKNHRYTYLSDRFTQLTGVDRNTMLGRPRRPLPDSGVSDEEWQRLMDDVAAYRPFRDFVSRRTTPNGNNIWLSINGQPVFDSNGEFQGYRGTGMDVTDRKLPEIALRQAKESAEAASNAKSQFLSLMSHELRTPLNAILGFGQLLRDDSVTPLNEEQAGAVNYIVKGGEHLLSMIEEILDLSRIEAGATVLSMDSVDLHGLLDDCLSFVGSMAAKRGISLPTSGDATGITVQADYTRLRQVVLNLLSNAIKYNRENGSVALSLELITSDKIRIAITDTGFGIAEEWRDELFQPFSRLGAETSMIEGTGIGLSISKRLIDMMGGNIGCDSTVGEGSTFWIQVPLAEPQANTDAAAMSATNDDRQVSSIAPETADNSAFTVLYIEDNPTNTSLMEGVFRRVSNARLISTHTAELGLVLAEMEMPDAILLDINLPGMNGREALWQLKNRPDLAHIPVAAVSADAMSSSIQDGLEAGFCAYLKKPFRLNEIRSLLEELRPARANVSP